MTRRGVRAVLLAGLALGLGGVPVAAAQAPDGQRCSQETAEQVAGPDSPFGEPGNSRVGLALCGSFAGPGSETMVVQFGAPTCWPLQGWAVYRYADGTWQRVLQRSIFLVPDLVAVGEDIKETAPIYRAGDPRCIPSGGEHARTWHWTGTRFAAGPWHRTKAAPPPTSASFFSPTRNIACDLSDDPRGRHVFCESFAHPHSVTMGLRGRLRTCRGTRTNNRCLGDPGEHTPVLRYGRSVRTAHFRCRSAQAGVTCTVIATGKGFRIDRDTTTRVG